MNNETMSDTTPTLIDIHPAELKKKLDERKTLLIDVREPGEFEAERIAGALMFPLSEFDPNRLPAEIFSSVVLMCGSGKRSVLAAQRVFDSGVNQVSHLAGGIMAWKQSNLPTIS